MYETGYLAFWILELMPLIIFLNLQKRYVKS